MKVCKRGSKVTKLLFVYLWICFPLFLFVFFGFSYWALWKSSFFLLFTIIYFVFIFFSCYKKYSNFRFSLIVFSVLFFLIEVGISLGEKLGFLNNNDFQPVKKFEMYAFPKFENPIASFDKCLGFRWSQNETMVYKYAKEELIFENYFSGNNRGFHAQQDYYFKKKDVGKRWIVFGDSFTDAYFLQSNWVDQVQKKLDIDKIPVQLYSFSINGGGIRNWYQIYNKLILPNFEFDGVIFAIFGNDLNRNFFVLHQTQQKELYKYYDSIPEYKEVMDDLEHSPDYHSSSNLLYKNRFIYTSKLLNYAYRNFLNYKFKNLFSKEQTHLRDNFLSPSIQNVDSLTLLNKYGQNIRLLYNMINSLKSNQKDAILLSIPELYGLGLNKKGSNTAIQEELDWIASQYEIQYIDGYQLFRNLTDSTIKSYYFPNDGHWNQKGSDQFASDFYQSYGLILK